MLTSVTDPFAQILLLATSTRCATASPKLRRSEVILMPKARKPCKDCAIVAATPGVSLPPSRPAPHPGPRCATHWRAERQRRSAAAHERRVQGTYDLGPGDYKRLLAAQGGLCAFCRRANGRTRRLSVDHDHRTGEVRGLLCGPCNKDVLGQARDDPAFFLRCLAYLANPPARAVLGAAA